MMKPARRPKASSKADQVSQKTVSSGTALDLGLPLDLQQRILNTFCNAAPIAQDSRHLHETIQEVKGHLYHRDFDSAFGKPEYLQAYALRWSASRALGYASIFIKPSRSHLLGSARPRDNAMHVAGLQNAETTNRKVVCIGGGAGAEIVSLAASQAYATEGAKLEIRAVDYADWTGPVEGLTQALFQSARLSSYASEAVRLKPENQPLVNEPANVSVSFLHQDVLKWNAESLTETLSQCSLCTIMFTLNELFSVSLPKTTAFLLQVTEAMGAGGCLLVVDSPGSYSEISLANKDVRDTTDSKAKTKKYPMKWLIDHTLLQVAGDKGNPKWEKVESEDSQWFRIDPKDKAKLKYPVELENMRFQLHCYKRL